VTPNPEFKVTPLFDIDISETVQDIDIVTMKY